MYIEVREDAAYVHGPAESAAGGLPLGMGGHAVSLLSGGIDSPVASYMIAKRGVQLEMIHFASPPYTGELAREKVLKLAEELTPGAAGWRCSSSPLRKFRRRSGASARRTTLP